jgi:hypothetical protein
VDPGPAIAIAQQLHPIFELFVKVLRTFEQDRYGDIADVRETAKYFASELHKVDGLCADGAEVAAVIFEDHLRQYRRAMEPLCNTTCVPTQRG